MPDSTRWYLLIDATYPWGEIDIHPAQKGGITDTFQHQNCNRYNPGLPWRTGNLCLKTSLRSFERRGYDVEPYGAAVRLAWHVERCKLWLELANANQLSCAGEPFELPHYPAKSGNVVAFSENAFSLTQWQSFPETAGLVRLKHLNTNSRVLFINNFSGFVKNTSIAVPWGDYLDRNSSKEVVGIWILLRTAPMLFPWQAPLTWSELFKVAAAQGIALESRLKDAFCKTGKEQPGFVLLGFPVASKIGEQPQQMHWLAIQLDKPQPMKGFRPNSSLLLTETAKYIFHPQREILWASTQNWDRSEINARGKLASPITSRSVLLVGAGAVGSALAELLSRAGCYQITIIDDDKVEIGNMARHTLTMDSLTAYKAEAVGTRLNKIFPYNTIKHINKSLKKALTSNKDLLMPYNLVIDTTGSDQVLYELALANYMPKSNFISLSLGLYAKRLFCFTALMSAAIAEVFRNEIQYWLLKEISDFKGSELPRDGIGCWHPLFPARTDDIWLLVSASLKVIEATLLESSEEPTLTVLEQQYFKDRFIGVSIVDDANYST
ncbi:ThiF family adenylyltransferase [Hymenobacter terricola]|uniref:ThiF family adenylyltransferase n=1 Tax=Hymenobacter terricola TaxID=2819236 RepID=UPI001CF30B4C|nr:ThiF family adenylyltransferase [Hymenobacter terricola]